MKLGCASSEDKKRSEQINRLLTEEKKKQNAEVKLLLLGIMKNLSRI